MLLPVRGIVADWRKTMAYKEIEWINLGDVNFSEHGGIMVRQTDCPGDYEFFQLLVNGNDRYAMHGTICDIKNYADELETLKAAAEESGCTVKELVENEETQPIAVKALIENSGYGALDFSPVNVNGEGAYSLNVNDFKLSEQELEQFMKNVDIPAEYWPEFEYQLTSMYEKNRGIEDTFKTNDWAEVETWAHEKAMKGNFVKIEDEKYGQRVTLEPERYINTFELRNGEFPVDERYFSVEYGDEEE